MTYLASDAIAEARTYFIGTIREQKNRLGADITNAATTISVTYALGAIDTGTVLTIGLERLYVWAAGSADSIIVQRGWDGTTAAAHTSGDVISINARVDDYALFRALNNELNSLSSPNKGLFRVRNVDLTSTPSTYGYDMVGVGTIIGSPLSVFAKYPGFTGDWEPVRPGEYVYDASPDATDFPSGKAIFLTAGSTGMTIRVLYRSAFSPLTALTSDVQAVSFLPSTANDVLAMGAALQLASTRPLQRSDFLAQSSARRADEVATQDTLMAISGLKARYDERVRDEALRLLADHPQAV